MDSRTFLVEISKPWAWPVALIFFCVIFYSSIQGILQATSSLLHRLKSFEAAGVKIDLLQVAVDANQEKVKAVAEKLEKEELSPEDKARLVSELKAAVAEGERLRSLLVQQSTAITSYETPATQLNPMRLIAKLLGANNVGFQSGSDEGREKTKRDAQSIINRIRTGKATHPYLNPVIIDALIEQSFIDESGLLTETGMSELLNWAVHELKRPSPSHPLR